MPDHHNPFPPYQRKTDYAGLRWYSCYIPMRDGTRLAADVYLPKGLNPGTRLPTILIQSRYWRAIQPNPPLSWFVDDAEELMPTQRRMKAFFVQRGYAMLLVDVRGTGASFGVWRYPWEPVSIDDAYDLLEWIVQQPWSNGRVGGIGISYLGTTAELLSATRHPAVKAIIPMFNHPDPYQDIAYPGGIFNARFLRDWSEMNRYLDQNRMPPLANPLARRMVRGVRPVNGDLQALQAALQDHQQNGSAFLIGRDVTYRDEIDPDIGSSVDSLAVHHYQEAILESIQSNPIASYGWASWQDGGTAAAALRRFLTYPNSNHVTIGAWNHGGFKQASPYRSPNQAISPSLETQRYEMLRFFDTHLLALDTGMQAERHVTFYTIGAERWQISETWPPPDVTVQRWYLCANHQLDSQPPDNEVGSQGEDLYTVDFRATTGSLNRWWELSAVVNKSIVINNRVEQSPYLLTYLTNPFERDWELCGYPLVKLQIACSVPDCAFFAYLEDVAPDGTIYYLTEGQLRAIHRIGNDHQAPKIPPVFQPDPTHPFTRSNARPLTPGEVTEICFHLHPLSAWLRAGHRLRLSLAGHDRGTFARIPAQDTPQWRVQRNRDWRSWIELPMRNPSW